MKFISCFSLTKSGMFGYARCHNLYIEVCKMQSFIKVSGQRNERSILTKIKTRQSPSNAVLFFMFHLKK